MKYIEYPQITEYQYYIISLICGLFMLYTPLYSCVVLIFLLIYGYTTRLPKIVYIIVSCLIGILIFYFVYKEEQVPDWYSSGKSYLIRGEVASVSYDSNKRLRVRIRNIIPLYDVDIQAISKKNPCNIDTSGILLYTKARTCAVAYPLESQIALPSYALYTITRDFPLIKEGQTIEGVFTIEDIHSNENGGFSLKEYYKQQHISYRIKLREQSTLKIYGKSTFFSDIREFAQLRFSTVLNALYGHEKERKKLSNITQDTIAIAHALLLGSRFYISQELEHTLLAGGLLHSIVLSGLHVSSFLIFSVPLVFLLIRLVPSVILYIPTRPIILFILIVFSLFYASLCSFPISYMRAITMVGIVLFFTVQYQRYTLLDVLLYTLLIVALFSPELLFTISLQLSCGAIFGIYLSLPTSKQYIQWIHKSKVPKVLRYICILFGSIIITTFFINLTLLPLMLNSFGVIAYSVFLNLLWLPLLSTFVLPVLLIAFALSLCGIIIQEVWYIGLFPIKVLLEILYVLNTHEWFDIHVELRPHAYTNISFYLALFSYMLVLNKRTSKKILYTVSSISILLLCIPIALRFYKQIDDTLIIETIDVGKGQAILIEHKGRRVLVDAGEKTPYFDVGERIISPLLTQNYFPILDSLILTHQDNDHIGGSIFLLRYYQINNIYYNGDDSKKTETILDIHNLLGERTMKSIQEGDTIGIDEEVALTILLPKRKEERKINIEKDSNAHSIVAMVTYKGENIALLLGDIDIAGQEYLVQKYGTKLQCDLLILPHHGSRHNMYAPLYEITKARYAIASTGIVNHNFVSPSMQQALRKNGIELYTTYRHGKITYTKEQKNTYLSYQKTK